MRKKRLVIFSGAGMSAESGIQTFRDNNGLWENHRVEDVATPFAWKKQPQLVLDFYNQRRKQLENGRPNEAHRLIAQLEKDLEIIVITQNIDNLHELAGSKNVLHLHGELTKVRCEKNPNELYDWGHKDLHLGDLGINGTQLRPHVVWFGEEVPMMGEAIEVCKTASHFLVIGTSLSVYPAANLVHYLEPETKAYIIDPKPHPQLGDQWQQIQSKAIEGMKQFLEIIA